MSETPTENLDALRRLIVRKELQIQVIDDQNQYLEGELQHLSDEIQELSDAINKKRDEVNKQYGVFSEEIRDRGKVIECLEEMLIICEKGEPRTHSDISRLYVLRRKIQEYYDKHDPNSYNPFVTNHRSTNL